MDEEKEKYIEETFKDFLDEISIIEKMSKVLYKQVQKLPKTQDLYTDLKDNTEVLSRVIGFFKMRLAKFYKTVITNKNTTLANPKHNFESS